MMYDIIQPVHQAFKGYPLLPDMNVCSCCTYPEEIKPLYNQTLDPLKEHTLELYGAKALSTWGGVKDSKHFLPQLFELEVYKALGFHYLSSKLELGEFKDWPLPEQEAVKRFLAEYFRLLTDRNEYDDAQELAQETRKVIPDFLPDNEIENLFKVRFTDLIYKPALHLELSAFMELIYTVAEQKLFEHYILSWPEDSGGILSFASFVNNSYHYEYFDEVTKPKIRRMKTLLETYWYVNENKKELPSDEILSALNVIETILPDTCES